MTNAYKIFKSLLPDPPLLVGEVTAFADGTATIELPDGGTITALGEAAIGDKVFVRNGAIEGPAPNLSVEIIDV